MFHKQTLHDIDITGKTVLLRADYNVPVENGTITDDYRIQQSLPTIKAILKQADKLIICSHLGRPEGAPDPALSLKPVAKRLEKLLEQPVVFAADTVGESAQLAAQELKPGGILLLENLRFNPGEKANDDNFAQALAQFGDVFVQDAFGVVHRKDASNDAITKHLPAVAGLLLAKEVETINQVMQKPDRPLMAIIGGAKIADKIEILERFIEIADFVAIGGGMANTFLAAQGVDVAQSLCAKEDIPTAKRLLKAAAAQAKQRPFVFTVPHDVVVAEAIDTKAPTRLVDLSSHTVADIGYYPKRVPASAIQLHAHEMILDIGPFSASFIAGAIQLAKTVVWNGTMGVTETPSLHGPIGPTAHGTQVVIEALLGDLGNKPFTVVGGGDTVGYVQSRNLTAYFDHVSTGGGAGLELMAGRKLPGIEALRDKK